MTTTCPLTPTHTFVKAAQKSFCRASSLGPQLRGE